MLWSSGSNRQSFLHILKRNEKDSSNTNTEVTSNKYLAFWIKCTTKMSNTFKIKMHTIQKTLTSTVKFGERSSLKLDNTDIVSFIQ